MDVIPPISNAVHLCIDMQNIFAEGGVWATTWMNRVLPTITHVAETYKTRTIFTRFIPPKVAEERPGQWVAYYTKWENATRDNLPDGQLDLVPDLASLVPPATMIDKPFYSAFAESRLHDVLQAQKVTTLVITGAETDICVLSTVLNAVDFGYRVILLEDALCSSSNEGHDALMTMYRTRLSLQIELLKAEQLNALWLGC